MRLPGIAALIIGYSLLAHYTNISAHNLGAPVAIAPLFVLALMLAWTSHRRFIMLTALILSCAALITQWSVLEQHFGLLYWLQDVGLQLMLLMTFGRTLIAGRQPLCTRFAAAVHPPLTQQHENYARKVTVAWTLFFALMALTSTLLFFLAPLRIWSIFANFLTLPLIALMFIVEYRVRRWALPDVPNTHILDAVRAFRNHSAR
jgi:uncharacterized membrane protein